jgi:hypothetical protein
MGETPKVRELKFKEATAKNAKFSGSIGLNGGLQ